MTEYVSTTPGLYPLPDWAKDSLSDLKGHQKHDLVSGDEDDEVVEEYDAVREELVDDQLSRGVDQVVEGQARWDDMIAHPLAVHPNVDTGGIVRYYDNNNFYRDPRVQGPLTESADVADELERAAEHVDGDADLQAVLPGPYSLTELATDEHYGDETEFQAAVAEFLAGEIELLPDVDSLFLLEPSLVEDAPEGDAVERAVDAVSEVAAAADADVVVHSYWGGVPEDVYTGLLDSEADAVGFDLVEGAEANLENVEEHGAFDAAAAGVVDGQNTLVEEPEEAASSVGELEEAAGGFDTVFVTSNTELFYLPENKYEDKLDAIAEATEVLS